MNDTIIFPFLIIIFSGLILFYIINDKKNKKLINCIEKFQDSYIENIATKLDSNSTNNTEFTKDVAQGSWTTLETKVDANYNATNLMVINITSLPGTTESLNYGTITFGDNNFFNINLISNMNLTAVLAKDTTKSISIKFINLKNEVNPVALDSRPFANNNIYTCIVSTFSNEVFIQKYASFKVYNNTVGGELYRIILAQDYYVALPPPKYNFDTYNKIIKSYIYPPLFIYPNWSTGSSTQDKKIYDKITIQYQSQIQFALQRTFKSPTGNIIRTKISSPLMIKVIQNNNFPDTMTIPSFKSDVTVNNFNGYFQPDLVYLYFYKIINENITYDYGDKNLVRDNISSLNPKNNGNAMFNGDVRYNKLDTVEKVNNNTYKLTLVSSYPANDTDSIIIKFQDISILL